MFLPFTVFVKPVTCPKFVLIVIDLAAQLAIKHKEISMLSILAVDEVLSVTIHGRIVLYENISWVDPAELGHLK